MKPKIKQVLSKLNILLIIISLWLLTNIYTNNLVPNPLKTFLQVIALLQNPEIHSHVLFTILNTIFSLFISIIIATIIVLSLQILPKFFNQLTSSITYFILFVPSIITIYISIILFGYNSTTIRLVIIFITTPHLITLFSSIPKQINKEYFKISHIFKLSKPTIIQQIILPQILPSLISSTKNGFSIALKISVLVEAIIGNHGVGYQIAYYFHTFDLEKVLALSIILILTTVYIPLIGKKIYIKIRN